MEQVVEVEQVVDVEEADVVEMVFVFKVDADGVGAGTLDALDGGVGTLERRRKHICL